MGSHVFNDMVAPRITSLTVNRLGVMSIFDTRFKDDLNKGAPKGDTERIKKPHRSNIRDGFNYVGQSIDRRYTTMVADQKFGADLDWDTVEKAIQMERGAEELDENLFKPRAYQMAQEWDVRAMRFVKANTSHVVGSLGTAPTLSTFTAARTRLIECGGWESATKKGVFMTPDTMGGLVSGSGTNIITLFNPQADSSDAFREGYAGKYAQAKWFESMSCQRHTTGVITTQLTGTTVSGPGQSGTVINLAGTTGNTLLANDKITFANVNEVNPGTRQSLGRLIPQTIVNDVTFVGSAATVTIFPGLYPTGPYQNCDSLPADAAIVLLQPGTTMTDATAKSGIYCAQYTNEAFGFCGIDLPMPTKGTQEYTDKYTDPDTGMTMGLWNYARFEGRSFSSRLDTWGGFVNLLGDTSSVLIAAAN